MAGFRSDVDIEWSFPAATHSEPALWWSKWNTGEYWERHAIARKRRGAPPDSVKRIVESVCPPREAPWLTVRDVIGDLPAPQKFESETHLNHVLQPGARPYPGHTGSPLDEPAKTLKAGDHGVPGGENMIVLPDASVRYLTVRESARIQTFPDDYGFRVSWTESMRQIGNAVPMKLAQTVADHMNKYLAKAQ
jgi:DNA (cytosine-5)-methyltransferase 1